MADDTQANLRYIRVLTVSQLRRALAIKEKIEKLEAQLNSVRLRFRIQIVCHTSSFI